MGAAAWVKLKLESRGSCFLPRVTGGTCEPLQSVSGGFGVSLAQNSFEIGVAQAAGCTLRQLQKAEK